MSGYQTILQLSALVGFWGAYASNALFPSSSSLQWQIPVAVQLAPGMLLLLGTMFVPESPRFLAERGRYQEVENALVWLRGWGVDVRGEIGDVREAARVSKVLGESQKSFWSEVVKRGVRQRMVVGIGLMIAQNMVGLNALNYCRCQLSCLRWKLLNLGGRCSCNLHVRWIHFGVVVLVSHWCFWCGQVDLRYCIYVCIRTREGESVLALTWFCLLRDFHADFGYNLPLSI